MEMECQKNSVKTKDVPLGENPGKIVNLPLHAWVHVQAKLLPLLLPSEERQWGHDNKPKESSTIARYGRGRNGIKMNAWDGKGIQEKRWKEREKAIIIGWTRDEKEIPEKEGRQK
jgi:hypothetical protein